VLLFFLGAMVFFAEDRFDRLEKTLAQQTTDISLLRAQLGELRVTTESLVSDASESTKQDIEKKLAAEREKLAQVEKKLAAESAARSKAESELKKTSSVSDTRISEVEKNLSSLNIEPIVSSWRPRTAYLECSFKSGKSSGSGVLMNFEKGTGQVLGVLTNQHVLVVNNVVADSCTVTFPDYTDKITVNRSSGDIEVSSEGLDFGRLVIRNAPASLSLRAASKTNTCSAKPAVGSELVILGYPNIGTSGDITATEGIVSGTDGDFYITSAKIERGNSGGPAVLVKDNCLVGIPTFVTVGILEALARVLDIGVIYR
jgi:S1-C subfamily serine protease